MVHKQETVSSRYFDYLYRLGSTVNAAIGLLCCVLLGALDVLTPPEYMFSFLYLFPISFTTWFAGKRAGLLASITCTAILARYSFQANMLAAVWNNLSTLGIFCVVAVMVGKIHQLLDNERILSRTDALTGAMNLRAFTELVEYEILRLRRDYRPFSIAYFDIDNFKKVNDRYGHRKGDELLKSVVSCLREKIRRTDIIARLGGDEFTIFFPSTDHEAVKTVTLDLVKALDRLAKLNKWPTTISMGVVTCSDGACELDDLISTADKLMYDVKHAGKNGVEYAVYPRA
ncbi:diguanylate cyclase [Oryzomonas rubra]|uniref:diguanylate cyclase n=1 Tax=Oryzomonas rubra TaxID=2509454 RepID=A0A5A9XMK8_9BACT|nr:diguanylate cyclase [Oryzomonas rubra]KAA0894080.1 diguanylate cyclase [Oryzomonas rubra]